MQGILQSNIFFFVTTIVVVVIALALLVLIMYGILILSQVRKIIDKVKMGTDEALQDIRSVRSSIRNQKINFLSVISFLITTLRPSKNKKTHTKDTANKKDI